MFYFFGFVVVFMVGMFFGVLSMFMFVVVELCYLIGFDGENE